MPNQPKTPVRGVRLPDEVWLPLEGEAEDVGVTTSALVRTILTRHVNRRAAQRRRTQAA